jgi:hypothetical protein
MIPEAQSKALVPFGTPSPLSQALKLRAARASHFCASVLVRVAVILLLFVGIGFAALHARLAYSPLTMTYLVPPIERAVNLNLAGHRFDIGNAVLRRSGSWLGIEFRLANVRLLDESGSPVIESPFASADVSLTALLTGRFAASHIDLIGPRLYLQYSDERGLALSFADPRESKDDLQLPAVQQPREQGQAADRQLQRTDPVETASPAEVKKEGVIRRTRGRAVGLTHALTDLFAKSRRGQSAYLQSFGIQDALVYFDHGEQLTSWTIPTAEIGLSHLDGDSAVTGHIAVEAPSGTFQVTFSAKQNRRSGQLALSVGAEDLVPRTFSAEFPDLRMLKVLDMPVALSAEMDLARNGDILGATMQASLKKGQFYAPWDQNHPAQIDHGDLNLSYSREQGLIQLSESELRWGGSSIELDGVLQRQRETGLWAFLFGSNKISLGAEQFGLPVIPLDRMQAQGRYDPKRGAIALDRFVLQAADAHITLAGNITQGNTSPAIRLTGRVSAMPIAFFKLIWPKFIAYGAREWIGHRIPSGHIAGGTLNVDIPADLLASLGADGHLPPEAVDFQLELENLEVHYISGMPPMQIERSTAKVAGQRFFFNVPAARIIAPSGEPVNFSDGQFIVGDLRPHIPRGEIHFKSEASAKAVLNLLDHPKLGYIHALNIPVPDIDAQVSSTFSIAMPMTQGLKFKHMKLRGRSEVENARATGLPGGLGIHGGALNFDVTEKAIEARGELKMNGFPVLVAWQRIFDAPADRQPPLRLRTVLGEKARRELGLQVDHLVRGGAAAELTVHFRREKVPQLHFECNLTEADILMASLGWRKPPGQRAVLTFDLEPTAGGDFALKNINLVGDDLTVRGVMSANAKGQPIAFRFPVVALNLQTQMEMYGELGPDNIWKVRVRGQTYDGRRLFRSLFSAGKVAEDQPQLPEGSPGLDIDAEIESVVGFFDTTLNSVKMTAQRRNNRLSYLDLHGQLNGQRLAARIQTRPGHPRQILAEATDAGAAFRLVGFYPSAHGGDVSLRVDLDGKGAAEKSGILYANNFVVANEQVVEEVLSRPQQQRTARTQQQAYDRLQFDRMRVPFSVGGGRFVLHDAAINGPILGATLRGSIDFNREQINLSGTYVPFYGINGALGFVPLLGDLLVSRSGEGLFGITFAVKGPTSKPDVLVNPMSVVAPGFLRQLFELDQSEPQIIPKQRRSERKTGAASSLPPVTR